MKDIKYLLKQLKKFWNFIWHDDSLLSYVLNFVFAFIFIKFLFFPGLSFVLDTDFPVVAIVSGSMEHKYVMNEFGQITMCGNFDSTKQNADLDMFWEDCGDYYALNYNLSKLDFEKFEYRNGLNIGDVMVLRGKDPSKIEIGDILVFEPQDKLSLSEANNLNLQEGDSFFFNVYGPVIHRVVDRWQDDSGKWYFTTKGDHNAQVIAEHSRLNGQLRFDDFEMKISEDDVIGTAAVRIPYVGYAKIVLSKLFGYVGGIF
jgi:signal peptidase I